MTTPDTLHADIIVVGAGVLGTFHAYFAAQKGYKVLLIERNTFPNDASTRNFGMVVRSIVETTSEWATFARDTREIYQTIQQEQDISAKVTGSLYIASTDAERAVLEEFAQGYAATYSCTYLTADEALYRYSFIQASYCAGALFFADDLTIEPRRLLRQLIPYVTQTSSVHYIPNTTIVNAESNGQQCVLKDAHGNTYTAERVFICSGADYQTLFPDLFAKSGLRVCKLQIMQTVPQPRILPHSILSGLSILRYPAFKSCTAYHILEQQPVDKDLKNYGIHLLFKQAVDGSIIIGDSHEYSTFSEASIGEEYTSCHINETILGYGKHMLTLPTWELQTLWNGYYLMHPEQQVYTETIESNIHIVTGIAGKGMSTGAGFSRQHINTVFA